VSTLSGASAVLSRRAVVQSHKPWCVRLRSKRVEVGRAAARAVVEAFVSKEGLCPIWKGFLFKILFGGVNAEPGKTHTLINTEEIHASKYMQISPLCSGASNVQESTRVPGVAGLPPGCVSGVVTRTAAAS